MKLLFLMLYMPAEGISGGMYLSLAEEFKCNGHDVTIMAPDIEHTHTFMGTERGIRIIRVGSKETQGVTNMFKKGIALATLSLYYKAAYKKYLDNEPFDWVLMPTPPISLSGFADYVKKKSGAKFYLILRDIHPQSIRSIGLLHNVIEYRFLDKKAKTGYKAANLIGCMSQGNIDFIKSQYPDMQMGKLTLLYNWVAEPPQGEPDLSLRFRLGLDGKYIILFGGNLGKGQQIENIVFLAEHYIENKEIVFLIIAKGVEKERLQKISEEKCLSNIRFMDYMPQADYLNLSKSVDLGLVSINENYKVPTCPSKAVSYMALGIPIFAIINRDNDYGQIIEDAGAGYWAVGSDRKRIVRLFDKLYSSPELRQQMGLSGRLFFESHCTVEVACRTILEQMSNN